MNLNALIFKYKKEIENIIYKIENDKKLNELEIIKLSSKYLILEDVIKDLEKLNNKKKD